MDASGPNKSDTPGRARDMAALLFAMAFPSFMSWLEFWVLPVGGRGEANLLLSVTFAIGKLIQFTFPVLYIWLIAGEPIRVERPSARGLRTGILFGIVIGLGTLALYFSLLKQTGVFDLTATMLERWLSKLWDATPATFLIIAFSVSVPHSLLEEYYWRWFVFGRLQRLLPWTLAVALSSLAFMSHHVFVLAYYLPGQFWIAAVPFSLCVACGGVAWAWLYHRSGSIYAPWISHLIVDTAIMAVGYDMLFGTR